MTTQAKESVQTQPVACVEQTPSGVRYRPNVDIFETASELTLCADLPGVARDDLDIQVEHGTLTIHGPVRPRGPQDAESVLCEYGVGDFVRSFRVSEQVDVNKISAELANGVLSLRLPKGETARPRKIAIKA